MNKIMFNINITKNGGVIAPTDIEEIIKKVGDISGNNVVIFSGRLPVWVYGALVHIAHPTLAVACFDPRLNGGVVVATHTETIKIGDIISIDDSEKINIEI